MKCFIVIFLAIASEQGSAGTIFSDGFESGDLSHTDGAAKWYGSVRTDVTNVISHSGKYSLRARYEAKPIGQYANAEQHFDLGSNAGFPDLWIQFYIYYPDGTEGIGPKYVRRTNTGCGLGCNDKIIRIWGAPDRTNNGPPATVGGGASTWPTSSGGSVFGAEYYTKLCDGTITSGQGRHHIPQFNFVNANTLGNWIKVKYRKKVASPANNDGIIQIWMNDVLMTDERNVPGYPGDGCINAFTAGYLFGWSNTGFNKETYIYMDDVTFSTSNDFSTSSTFSTDQTTSTGQTTAPPLPPDAIK